MSSPSKVVWTLVPPVESGDEALTYSTLKLAMAHGLNYSRRTGSTVRVLRNGILYRVINATADRFLGK